MQTPSSQIILKSSEIITLPADELGRIIKLRKPGMLAQYRLVEMVGGHAATNPTYMGMIAPLIYIAAIDDDDEIPLNTKRELEALITRLGEEGIKTVVDGVQTHFPPTSMEEQKTEIKKSEPTQS